MNYYEHHLADYTQATAHLSFIEDAAYSRMLRWYYANEKPLPKDVKQIERLVRAQSKIERDAVKTILDEFFYQESDGWHQDRADNEISRYQDKQRKASASANARWSKQKTQDSSIAFALRPDMRMHNEGNAPQTPDPKPQSPDSVNKTQTITENEVGTLTPGSVCVFLRQMGIVHTNPEHADLLEALRGGASKSDFSYAATEAVNKGKSFAYLLKIVLGRVEERKNPKVIKTKTFAGFSETEISQAARPGETREQVIHRLLQKRDQQSQKNQKAEG